MAAPTNAAKREESSCQLGAVHTWHETDMPKSLGDVRCWVNSGKHLLALSFSGFDRLRENVRARKARRMVFSIVLSRQPSPALLFFKLIEVETQFPFANSISEFSRSQDPKRTLRVVIEGKTEIEA